MNPRDAFDLALGRKSFGGRFVATFVGTLLPPNGTKQCYLPVGLDSALSYALSVALIITLPYAIQKPAAQHLGLCLRDA